MPAVEVTEPVGRQKEEKNDAHRVCLYRILSFSFSSLMIKILNCLFKTIYFIFCIFCLFFVYLLIVHLRLIVYYLGIGRIFFPWEFYLLLLRRGRSEGFSCISETLDLFNSK